MLCLQDSFTLQPVADKTEKPAILGHRLRAAVLSPRKVNRKTCSCVDGLRDSGIEPERGFDY